MASHASRFSSKKGNASQDWSHSSGDESTWNSYRPQSRPASSSNEALWRFSKRIGSSYRWLKLDLLLLAECDAYTQLLVSIETVLEQLGGCLLPDLGKKPIGKELSSRPEVVDLIGLLSSFGDATATTRSRKQSLHKELTDSSVQTGVRRSMFTKGVQASTDYMVRVRPADVIGEWEPLLPEAVRRGMVIKCSAPVCTDNAETHNIRLAAGELAKVVNKDADGDVQIVLLSRADVGNLWIPSRRFWVLSNSFRAFELPAHADRNSEEAMGKRFSRSNDIDIHGMETNWKKQGDEV